MSEMNSISRAAEADFQKAVRELFQHARKGYDDAEIMRSVERQRTHQVNNAFASWMLLVLVVGTFVIGAWFNLDLYEVVSMAVLAFAVGGMLFVKLGLLSAWLTFIPETIDEITAETVAFFNYKRLSPAEIDDLSRLALAHDPCAAIVDTWLKDGSPLRKRDAMAVNRFVTAHTKYRSRLQLVEEFNAAAARGRVAYASYFT